VGGAGYGVAPEASIHGIKVLRDNGKGPISWAIFGMEWVVSKVKAQPSFYKPAVVSLSLGSESQSSAYRSATELLYSNGIVVVVAAGNKARDACHYSPAFVPEAITVGSIGRLDAISSFSNYGTCVDVFAPGEDVLSAGVAGDSVTATKSGTSMACPHVAGIVALMFESNPAMTPKAAADKLSAEGDWNRIQNPHWLRGAPNLIAHVGAAPPRCEDRRTFRDRYRKSCFTTVRPPCTRVGWYDLNPPWSYRRYYNHMDLAAIRENCPRRCGTCTPR
jgi:subtilisin family serine protease